MGRRVCFFLNYFLLLQKSKGIIMIKILYIHGYGSIGNSRTALEIGKNMIGKAEVFSPAFSNDLEFSENAKKNIEKAKEFILKNDIKLVVASSMGAFTATFISSIPTILINPCLKPSEQLDQRIALNISSEEKEKYREMENRIITEEYKTMVYGVFANNDELFSYKSLFEEIYDKEKIFTIEDGHRISTDNIREVVVPLIEQIINTHNIQSF